MDDLYRLSPVMVSRKLQVLAFIHRFYGAHGVGPSLGEIAAAVQSNRTRAQAAVRQLAKEGRIHRQPGKARGIRPISVREEAMRVLQAEGWTVLQLEEGGTNASLSLPPELDHLPDASKQDGGKKDDARGAEEYRQQ